MAEEFVENLYTDEFRSGFLVTSHRKKLWNVQIALINEFSRICKKYNLKWFAYGGTLLGAVRHKGFIPWDDDSDIVMLRPDYEKFKKVAKEEIKPPYFCDNWYEYHLETEEPLPEKLDPNYQYITRLEFEKQNPMRWISQWPSIRLRDSRTTMLEFPERKHIHQGIFMDIFPFDPLPPLSENRRQINFRIACELMLATAAPLRMKAILDSGETVLLDRKILKEFLNLPYRERGRMLEERLLNDFFESEYLGSIRNFCIINHPLQYKLEYFKETVELPFEKIKVSASYRYEEALTAQYGDWHTMKITHNHAQEWSADIPYTEYYQKSTFMQ